MTDNARFSGTLTVALALAWAFSGERFLDLAFEMPDMWALDDVLLAGLLWAEDAKAALGLPDLFGALRSFLHMSLGLG